MGPGRNWLCCISLSSRSLALCSFPSGGDGEGIEHLIYETDLVFDARLTGEAMPWPDSMPYFKALDRGGRCPHRLKVSGRMKDSLQGAMIGFKDVVQEVRGPRVCVLRKLALPLQPMDCLRVRAEWVGGNRGGWPVAHGRQRFAQQATGRPSVAAIGQHEIDQPAMLVYQPLQQEPAYVWPSLSFAWPE